MERDFKGVWIPKEIWLNTALTATEKFILTEIDSLDNEKGCTASNEYLAEFCQCGITKVSTAITKLIKLGYIEIVSFDGRIRIIKSRLSKSERQNNRNCEQDVIINNTNKDNDKIKHKYGEYAHVLLTNNEFEKLSKDYGTQETRDAIKYLDEYIEMKGTKYKNHNLVLRKWVFEALKEQRQKNYNNKIITHEYSQADFDALWDSLDEQ